MSDTSQSRIVIRHLSGSKINQVEQIPLRDLHEITLGRDVTSTIAYDQKRDDVVSRRHAVIRIEEADKPGFKLVDLGSSNGTFVNGEPVTGEIELAPDDIIELGKGGPKFSFDVQPRPANFAARTRVIDALDSTVTRAIAGISAEGTREAAAFTGSPEAASTVPPKVGVGKDTVVRMLKQERRSTSRVWMGSIAAVLALLAVGGFGVYRHSLTVDTKMAELDKKADDAGPAARKAVLDKMGLTAKDIHEKYANSVVFVRMTWRVFDRQTGKPLFHKLAFDPKDKRLHAAFINTGTSLGVVRWLTIEDEGKTNVPIMGDGSGSGFVIGEDGFILTNKHVAAGWMIPFSNLGIRSDDDYALVFPLGFNPRHKGDWDKVDRISFGSSALSKLRRWYPEQGGFVFDPERAVAIGGGIVDAGENGGARVFNGRNELLEVRFPGNRMSMEATFVRASTDNDAALIKVEAVQKLKPVELASADDKLEVGDKTYVLGYPGVSDDNLVITHGSEAGVGQERVEMVPEPTLTDGIVSHLGEKRHEGVDVSTLGGDLQDSFQLTINTTGHGNSGGPVFNDKGRVIGLFTYGRERQGAAVSFAVPIKYGLELLNPQRTAGNQ